MNRPEIILAPGPDADPARGAAWRRAAPRVPPRPGVRRLMTDVTARLVELYRTGDRRHPADDLERHRRVSSRRSRTASRPARRSSCRSPGSSPIAGAAWPRPTASRVHTIEERVGDPAGSSHGRGRARGASGHQGRAPDPVRDLDRRDPARSRAWPVSRATPALMVVVDVVSSLGAVPFAFDDWGIDVAVGGSQKALSASPGIAFVAVIRRAAWAASEDGDEPPLLLRLADLPAVRRAPAPREPVDAGDQRDAGPGRGARALLRRRGRRRAATPPDAVARRQGRCPRPRPRPVRRGAGGQLDRHRDPCARGPRCRHDQRPDPRRLRMRARARAGPAERAASSGSGTSATSASSTSSAVWPRSR